MPFSAQSLALPHVAALHPYTPGLQPGEAGWVKLNTNENPYPPSPRVAEAVRRETGEDGAALRLYPNPASRPLRAAIAAAHGLGEDQVLVGNGSDDVLNLLVRAFCSAEAPAGYTWPSYSLYPVIVGMQGGRCVPVEFARDMRLPSEAILASGARLFLITSPNAPTGVGFRTADIAAILASFPGIVVVDEAYAAFADEDATALVATHRNLVITRTLSKSHGLAGMRIGYALADPEVIGILDRVRDSYNVSRLAQAAGIAAIGDPAHTRGVVARIRATRDACVARWGGELGWFTYRSQANFIFTEPRDRSGRTGPGVARSAFDFLYSRRVLVRYFPSHALTASFLRVSVGTDAEMGVLNQSLDAWLKQTPQG